MKEEMISRLPRSARNDQLPRTPFVGRVMTQFTDCFAAPVCQKAVSDDKEQLTTDPPSLLLSFGGQVKLTTDLCT